MQRGDNTRLIVADRSLRRDRLVALVLVIGLLAATMAAWAIARDRENHDAEKDRRVAAAALVGSLSADYAQTEAVLASTSALVDQTGAVDPQRLTAFAEVLMAPGLAGAVAYEPIVLDEQRAQFESKFGLRIVDRGTDGTFAPAPRRSVYFPVAAVHPLDDTQRRVLGFDIAQDLARGDTARLAREAGTARVTPVVPLAPSTRPGYLIFQPLKRADGEVAGFLSVTYLGEAIGQSIRAGLPADTRFRIVDGGVELFRTPSLPRENLIESLAIGGRAWQIDLDIPVATSRTASTAILVSGLALTALAALAALLSSRHQRALLASRQQIARERDLASVLALAVTSAEVMATAAETIPQIAPARAVSIGLLDGHDLNIQHSSNLDPSLTQRWAVIPVAARTPFSDAARSGKPIIFRDTAEIETQYPNVQLDSLGAARAVVCNPLAVGQQVIGAIAFGFAEVQAFDAEQLRWLEQISAMVAGALERARLYDTQTQVAVALQRDLLPAALPVSSGFTLSAAYRPGVALAVVGGDWYDAFELSDGRLAITIGDVAGKGVRAAASMGKIRHVIRACAGAYREPALVLGHANRLICEGSRDVFATACYMTVDSSGECHFALAGHPPPLHLWSAGAQLEHAKPGAPLGVYVASLYEEAVFHIDPAERIILYTDGLFERPGEDIDRSLERLIETALVTDMSIDAAETLADAMHEEGRDDVVVLVVERTESDSVGTQPPTDNDHVGGSLP